MDNPSAMEALGRELEQVFKGPGAAVSSLDSVRANWTRVADLVSRNRFQRNDDPGRWAFTCHAEFSRGHKSVLSEGENDPNREGWTRLAHHLIDRFSTGTLPLPIRSASPRP